jgi:hypothetical protein
MLGYGLISNTKVLLENRRLKIMVAGGTLPGFDFVAVLKGGRFSALAFRGGKKAAAKGVPA